MCKRSIPEPVSACQEENPELLNCLAGQPLREAALGRNIQVVRTLLETEGILLNLQGQSGLVLDFSSDDSLYRQAWAHSAAHRDCQ